MNTFKYIEANSIEKASKSLKKLGKDAIPFAGGTDVLGLMKDDIISPNNLVNLKRIDGLDKINYTKGSELRIGSLVKISELLESEIIKDKFTALWMAAKDVASPQLRNVGTIGGNICQRPRCWYFRGEFDCIRKGGDTCYAYMGQNKYHCIVEGGPCYIVHPSDTAVALTALDAKLAVFNGKDTRTISINDFFVLPETDPMIENILKDGEIVTEIIIPEKPADTKSAYVKFQERGAWDFAIVNIAVEASISINKIVNPKIAFGGVAPIPYQHSKINALFNGVSLDEKVLAEKTKQIFNDADPLEMNEYKIPLTRNLLKNLFLELA